MKIRKETTLINNDEGKQNDKFYRIEEIYVNFE